MAKNGSSSNTAAAKEAKPQPTQALATISPEMLKAMQESESGFEGTGAGDYSIPFLALLQKLSPQCDESDDAYVQGAKPGLFYNGATGKLHTTVRVIPCFYKRSMVEWKPERGGFVAQHEPGVEEGLPKNDRGVPTLPNGNLLVDTRYFMCLQLDEEGNRSPIVVALTSTQLKKAKTWMSRMQALKVEGPHGKFTPPMYSHVWVLSSMDESNDKGSWKGIKMELEGPVNSAEMFAEAKQNRETFSTTTVQPSQLLIGNGDGGEIKM